MLDLYACVREMPALSEWHPKSRLGERGGTPSTGLGWNDLDRMVKWREGGGETNTVSFAILRLGEGVRRTSGQKQYEAAGRIP